MNELRTIPIYRALSRPDLLMGCERKPILTIGLLSFMLIIIAQSLVSAVIGVVLWSSCFALLRRMAKADPYMSELYMRHIKYQAYYPPRATIYAPAAIWKRDK